MAGSTTDGWSDELHATTPENSLSSSGHQFSRWPIPIAFVLMSIYVELAGKYTNHRRKWSLIAVFLSNMFFFISMKLKGNSLLMTICVLAFGFRPFWVFAELDYKQLRPTPRFYTIVVLWGLAIPAFVVGLYTVRTGTLPTPSAWWRPIATYLLLSMTASYMFCMGLLRVSQALLDISRSPRPGQTKQNPAPPQA